MKLLVVVWSDNSYEITVEYEPLVAQEKAHTLKWLENLIWLI